jgi:hypothetical protein
MALVDPHSYADDAQPRTKHLRLHLAVDFEKKRIDGRAILELASPAGGPMDLDTKGLTIVAVTASGGGEVLTWAEDPILGRRLRLKPPGRPRSSWLLHGPGCCPSSVDPRSKGKKHLYLQPVPGDPRGRWCRARTRPASGDVPREVTVPEALSAVMSAGPSGVLKGKGTRTFLFDMPQAIPTYLLALAVGELESRDLSPRARVWAEPATVEKAAWEFAGVEEMIVKAEGLFGPYDWDRYDMLVLPPSFPYGGMENPRMTFLTPTLLAGDRSLVDVVAHELAHSWTGNLVTNATSEHFWLNEGFTVWAERRILEAIHGEEAATLGWALGQKALEDSIARFGADSPLTKLRTHLEGIDPDDAFSSVPYEKGARLVVLLERTVGRAAWDAFLADYMKTFRFQSITTEEFFAFLEQKLPGTAAKVNADAWLHEPGLPANAPVFRSEKAEALAVLAEGWEKGVRPTSEQIAGWNASETLLYLQHLPRKLSESDCAALDAAFGLMGKGNYELLVEWLVIASGSDYEPAFGKIREVLSRVGRMKYLRPLYTALGATERTRALARDIFAAQSPSYHGLSRRVVSGVLEKYAG